MEENKKKIYVSPSVESVKIEMEQGIAAGSTTNGADESGGNESGGNIGILTL